jgi:hypothetical protein
MVTDNNISGAQKLKNIAKSHKNLIALGSAAAAINYLGFCEFCGTGRYFYDIAQYDILMHGSACVAITQGLKDISEQLGNTNFDYRTAAASLLAIGAGWEALEWAISNYGLAHIPGVGLTLASAKDIIIDTAAAYTYRAKQEGKKIKDAAAKDYEYLCNLTKSKLKARN